MTGVVWAARRAGVALGGSSRAGKAEKMTQQPHATVAGNQTIVFIFKKICINYI